MTTKIKLWDGVIACVGVIMIGAPSVLGDHATKLMNQWYFYGGGGALFVFLIWKLFARSNAETDIRPANVVGRDNSGIQQVIHGGVHYHAPSGRPRPLFETDTSGKISARNVDLPSDLGFPLAKASTGGQVDMDGIRILREATQATNIFPDCPIRELFLRIKPDLSTTPTQRDFEDVSSQICDRLSIGQLAAWGKAYDGTRTLPLASIPIEYWRSAKLHSWLLQSETEGGNILQADPIGSSAGHQYREILINRAQAEAIWPIKSLEVRRDVWLQDAVLFALYGRWLDQEEPGVLDGDLYRAQEVSAQMRERAGDGVLTIWGRGDVDRLYEVIPKEFWIDQQIDILRLFGDEAKNVQTESATWRLTDRKYVALMTSRAQVEALWPTPVARQR